MDELNTKITQFQTALQEFYTSTGIEALMKTLVDFGTKIINFLNSMPKLFGKIPTTAIGMIATMVSSIKTAISALLEWIIQKVQQSHKKLAQKTNQQATEQGKADAEAYATARANKTQLAGSVAGSLINLAGTTAGTLVSNQGVGQMISGGTGVVAGAILAATGNPLAGVTSILSGIANLANGLINKAKYDLEALENEAQELHNAALLAKDDYKNLDDYVEKYNKLQESQFDSADAAEDFIDVQNEIAETYPELIQAYDAQGNAIIDASNAEKTLAQLRKKTAEATYDAAVKEAEVQEEKVEDAKEAISDRANAIVNSTSSSELAQDLYIGNDINIMQEPGTGWVYSTNFSEWEAFSDQTAVENLITQRDTAFENLKSTIDTGTGAEIYLALKSYEDINKKIVELINTADNQFSYGDSSSFGEDVKDYYEALQLLNSSALKVISSSMVQNSIISDTQYGKLGEYYSIYEDNSALFSVISKQLADQWAQGDFGNTENITSAIENENYKNAEQKYLQAVELWYDNQSDAKKELVETIFGDSSTYGAEEAIALLGLNSTDDSEIINLITNWYSETSQTIANRMVDKVGETFGIVIEEAEDGTKSLSGNIAERFCDLTKLVKNEKAWTQDEETIITSVIEEAESLESVGLTESTEKYLNSFASFWDTISNLSTDQQLAIKALMLSADLTTSQGIRQFTQDLKNLDIFSDEDFEEIESGLTTMAQSVVDNIILGFGVLESSISSASEKLNDMYTDLSKSMDFSDALEKFNTLTANGVEGSFTDFFENDISDPTKWVFKSTKALQTYQDAIIGTLQTDADELQKKAESVSSDSTFKDSIQTAFSVSNFEYDDTAGTSIEQQAAEYYRDTFLKDNQELKTLIDEAGLSDVIISAFVNGTTTEDLSTIIQEQIDSIGVDAENAALILQQVENYATLFQPVANGEFKNALNKLNDIYSTEDPMYTVWKNYINETAQKQYRSMYDDFIEYGSDYVVTHAQSYGEDVRKIIEGWKNPETKKPYGLLYDLTEELDLTTEEWNEYYLKAWEATDKGKAISDAAKEAFDNLQIYGFDEETGNPIIRGTMEQIEAFATALDVKVDELITEADALGNYGIDYNLIKDKINKIDYYQTTIAEMVYDNLQDLVKTLSNGVTGKLKLSEKNDLIDTLSEYYGISIDSSAFIETAEGFKIMDNAAFSIVQQLSKIDYFAGQSLVEDIAKDLSDTDDSLDNIFSVMDKIADLEEEVKSAEGDKKTELEGQLAVYKKIASTIRETDNSFNFMKTSLAGAYDDPMSAWQGVADAFEVLDGDDFENGYMSYENLNAMVTLMGDEFLQTAGIFNGKITTASELMDEAAQAIVTVDGEVMVDLGKLGTNFNLSADNMKVGIKDAIQTIADSQIKMLDAEINMLETIVETQGAFENLDEDNTGELSVNEFMPTLKEENVYEWSTQQLAVLKALQKAYGDIEIAGIKISEMIKHPEIFAASDTDKQAWVDTINSLMLTGDNITLRDDGTVLINGLTADEYKASLGIITPEVTVEDPIVVDENGNETTAEQVEKTSSDWVQKWQNRNSERISAQTRVQRAATHNVYTPSEESTENTVTLPDITANLNLTKATISPDSPILDSEGHILVDTPVVAEVPVGTLIKYDTTAIKTEEEKIADTLETQISEELSGITPEIEIAPKVVASEVTISNANGAEKVIEESINNELSWDSDVFSGISEAMGKGDWRNFYIFYEGFGNSDDPFEGDAEAYVTAWQSAIDEIRTYYEKKFLNGETISSEEANFLSSLGQLVRDSGSSKFGALANSLQNLGFENGGKANENPLAESISNAVSKRLSQECSLIVPKSPSDTEKTNGLENKILKIASESIQERPSEVSNEEFESIVNKTFPILIEDIFGQVGTYAEEKFLSQYPSTAASTTSPQETTEVEDSLESMDVSFSEVLEIAKRALEILDQDPVIADAKKILSEDYQEDLVDSYIQTRLQAAFSSDKSSYSFYESLYNPTALEKLSSAMSETVSLSEVFQSVFSAIAQAMQEIPTDGKGAKAIEDTGTSIEKLPSSKTVKVNVKTTVDTQLDLDVNANAAGGVTIKGAFTKNNTFTKNSALAKGTKKTLMGELGPELVVSDGKYFTVGENGAEFVNLPDDAIVFNHLQTKKLLSSGKSSRGTSVVSDKKAVSYAKGNAKASASDTLAELKKIRSMWESLLQASMEDLGKKAGSSGGGGGGGSSSSSKAITHDLERWYNLLRQIEKCEQQITLEQAKRKNMNDGYDYSDSLEEELLLLKEQKSAYEQLAAIQKDWYDIRRQELLNTDYAKIFTYDEDGLMQYVDGADRGLDILAKLNATDANGAPTGTGANSDAQIAYLKSIGFDVEKYLRMNADGTKAETNDDLMNNFWDDIDGWMDELDGLYDEYNEHVQNIEENVAAQNEILQEYIDNQLDVEDKLKQAIEDREQAIIDKLEDLKDATQDAADEYINGLSEALSKEQDLYNQNESDKELSKLQRQLAILQRSGGSASEIKNLQDQIASKMQDEYFNSMQDQIDAIQEASDNQIEKLQQQIDIATEALEYQKENGLLWREVYEMMNEWTPEAMLEFIEKYTSSYREDSTLTNSESSKETKKQLEIWAAKRDNGPRDEAWENYYASANYDDSIKKANEAAAQRAYNEGYAAGGQEEAAARANKVFEDAIKAEEVNKQKGQATTVDYTPSSKTSSSSGGSSSSSSSSSGSSQKKTTTKTEEEKLPTVLSMNYKAASMSLASTLMTQPSTARKYASGITVKKGTNLTVTGIAGDFYRVKLKNGTTGYILKGSIKFENAAKTTSSSSGGKFTTVSQFASGGLVDYTGPAWVDGTKTKPEAFLSAEDTALLKSKIFSNSDYSLRSCIDAISSLAENAQSIGSTDNSQNVNIENISIQVGNGTISSDYTARRAGQEIMDEIVSIARKSGNLTLSRR